MFVLWQVLKDYQDTWRSYDELKVLREVAVKRLKQKLGEEETATQQQRRTSRSF